jgi:hypothetical protein
MSPSRVIVVNRDLFVKVSQMGAHLVRISVHPVAWRERWPREYTSALTESGEVFHQAMNGNVR